MADDPRPAVSESARPAAAESARPAVSDSPRPAVSDSPRPTPASVAGRRDTAAWEAELARLRALKPAESLAAAEALLSDLDEGLRSL
ncbi:hypothetical protein AB0I45_13355 [Brevibacterium sp. NPDC049920]|uniref:hypothetical protein n=1 Tax=Brevibacterium sp. NPDC049920 TaxID=3155279 RepID=UPI003410A2B0